MTALSRNRSLDQVVAGFPKLLQVPVDGGTHLYEGSSVAPLTATGVVTNGGGVASTNACIGIAASEVDNSAGSDGAKSVDILQGIFKRVNSATSAVTAAYRGKAVYAEDDQTVRVASGATYPLLGIFVGFMDDGTTPLVFVSEVCNYLLSQGSLAADLLAVTDAHGASLIGLEDDANLTAQVNVEEAIQELEQDARSAHCYIPLLPAQFLDVTGAPLLVFASADSAVPGLTLDDSKAVAMRWNNKSTHTAAIASFVIPADMDLAVNPTVVVQCAKIGATNNAGNTTTFDVALYNQAVGAVEGADTNYGGTTGAVTPDATTKTIQEVTLAVTASNLPAKGESVSLLIKPTDGTLDTDDISILSVKIKYARKYRTA
jgi:hypothetical protein